MDKLHYESGVSSVALNYALNIDNSAYVVDFMVNEPPVEQLRKLVEDNGGKIFVMPELRLKKSLKYLISLIRFYNEHKEYRIIHGHVANSAVFYLGMAMLYKVPYRIIHSHNSYASDIKWKAVRNKILCLPIKLVANRYLACSRVAANFLFGNNLDNVQIIHNAIEIDKFRFDRNVRNEARLSLSAENNFVVGHVGRMCLQKNHSFLLKVFKEIKLLEPKSILFLVGDGELRSELEQESKNLGISESVQFLGITKNIPEFMQAIDLLIMPSLFEGLPVVGVEAQATGLACIFSSNITSEVKIGDNTEFMPLEASPEEWAKKALELGRNYKREKPIQGLERYDIHVQAQRLKEYYDSLYKEMV